MNTSWNDQPRQFRCTLAFSASFDRLTPQNRITYDVVIKRFLDKKVPGSFRVSKVRLYVRLFVDATPRTRPYDKKKRKNCRPRSTYRDRIQFSQFEKQIQNTKNSPQRFGRVMSSNDVIFFSFRSGVPEHGTVAGHNGPLRGGGIRAENVRFAGRLAFQGPCKSRDQQGVGAGHAGQTSRRSRPILGRRDGVQARGQQVASVLRFSGTSSSSSSSFYFYFLFFFVPSSTSLGAAT